MWDVAIAGAEPIMRRVQHSHSSTARQMAILTSRSPPDIQKLQSTQKSTQAALFPAGLAAQAEFRDVDQLTATIKNWNHDVVQLGRGAFHGRLTLAHTSSLQLYRAAWSPAFLVQGRVPPKSIVFGAQCGGAPDPVWRGKELAASDVLLLDSHQEVDLQTKGDCDVLVMSIGADVLAQHAEALLGQPLRLSGSDRWNMLGRSAVGRQMVRNWMRLLHSALHLGDRLCDQQVAAQVEAEALEILLVHAAPPTREAPLAERRRVALRARQYIVENMEEPLTIKDICQEVHSSERTLHFGFREAFDMTPKRFLKSLRLNAIRRDLQKANPYQTVTSLACRWGFFHFSNFAADYFRQFGELPSETLRRSSESTSN